MLRAVKLGYQAALAAAEINDAFIDWKLATKLEAAKLTSAKAVQLTNLLAA